MSIFSVHISEWKRQREEEEIDLCMQKDPCRCVVVVCCCCFKHLIFLNKYDT